MTLCHPSRCCMDSCKCTYMISLIISRNKRTYFNLLTLMTSAPKNVIYILNKYWKKLLFAKHLRKIDFVLIYSLWNLYSHNSTSLDIRDTTSQLITATQYWCSCMGFWLKFAYLLLRIAARIIKLHLSQINIFFQIEGLLENPTFHIHSSDQN